MPNEPPASKKTPQEFVREKRNSPFGHSAQGESFTEGSLASQEPESPKSADENSTQENTGLLVKGEVAFMDDGSVSSMGADSATGQLIEHAAPVTASPLGPGIEMANDSPLDSPTIAASVSVASGAGPGDANMAVNGLNVGNVANPAPIFNPGHAADANNGHGGVPPALPGIPGAPPALNVRMEEYPPLPLSPFHEHAMHGANRGGPHFEVPGRDNFPVENAARELDGAWMSGPFDQFVVGGRVFSVPILLLERYGSWRLLRCLQRQAAGYVFPDVHWSLFALLMECLVSAYGFDGTEPGLTLVKLVSTLALALNWDMSREVHKLEKSIKTYIARRVLFRNPFHPDAGGNLDHSYYLFRSEEIYRTWNTVILSPTLEAFVPRKELIGLYIYCIPSEIWPALTTHFSQEFTLSLEFTIRLRAVPPEADFHEWWLTHFRRAGYIDHDWLPEVPHMIYQFYADAEQRNAPGAGAPGYPGGVAEPMPHAGHGDANMRNNDNANMNDEADALEVPE